MEAKIQKIIDGGKMTPELERKIDQFKDFEERYYAGEGDVISGLKIMDRYEEEIIVMANITGVGR